jgi:uncharacterized protein (TIGR03790 family)
MRAQGQCQQRRTKAPACLLLLTWLFCHCPSSGLFAAESGSNAVVVYNSRLSESKAVALHYAARRAVPTNQLLGLSLPTGESMTRADFNDMLQKPLLSFLLEGGFWRFGPATNLFPGRTGAPPFRMMAAASVRYAVLCYGVPTRILPDDKLQETNVNALQPQLRRNEAAVDSELALLPSFDQKPSLTGPVYNPFYGATNAASLHPTNGVLLLARLDGPTPAIARGLVDKAIEAETNGLWGRAYFDSRGITNGEYATGDDWMRRSAAIARQLGFETELDAAPATWPASHPLSDVAVYAGWYDGEVSGPFTRAVDFAPGAFAYHLHSFSAMTLRSTNARWVGPLLARGATATMGCVEEPYLTGTPDLPVFFARFLGLGFSLGEAACAAQSVLSWQVTVVGDPLYRPFQRPPELVHGELQRQSTKAAEWSHLGLAVRAEARGASFNEMTGYLQGLPQTRQSAVLTEKLGDLYWKAGKFADGLDYYQHALKRGPTKPQRARLLLGLGEKRSLIGPDSAAHGWFKQFLEEFPEWPQPELIYEKMLALARRMNQPEEIARCEKALERLRGSGAKGR